MTDDPHGACVAEAILEQLGGRMFCVMTGAKSVTASPDTLSFQLPARFAKDKICGVRVRLDASDTYTVTFLARPTKANGYVAPVIAEYVDIYADNLQYLFTRVTGLETSMGTVKC